MKNAAANTMLFGSCIRNLIKFYQISEDPKLIGKFTHCLIEFWKNQGSIVFLAAFNLMYLGKIMKFQNMEK